MPWEIGLSEADQEKLFVGNARRFFRLGEVTKLSPRTPANALA